MNLIEVNAKIKARDKTYQQLLGKKSILVDSLKKLGFENLEDAKKSNIKLGKEIFKMEQHYKTGTEKFKRDFGHLLT